MRVTELKEMKLVGLRVVCEGDQYVNEIPRAAITLKNGLKEIKEVVTPTRLIGAFIVGDFTDEEDGYWVCVEVKQYNEIPVGMVFLTIPPQKYAVIKHKGPNYKIRDTYEVLHKWIDENRFERIVRSWHLEISDEWGSNNSTEVEVELHDTIK
ncbi:GyrI-like domain-containing protein [Paenibacillus eucommiae]|uniref:Transcriptional regulator YdeE n=1 Tax=Paenibacillus eucommiae TaxID=1355755 RepID=A0ABS4IUH2_9BACL|nr:GyrI-like domain-containing protein [Paenibacillus eucommiae]MBP1991217.1 putative transcriptional regulator YdeE [Paenibacillus eucommiae]